MSDPLPLPLRTKRERATEEVKSDSRVVSARTVSRRQSRFFPFARMPPYRRYMNQRPRYGSNYQLQRTIKRTIERQAEKKRSTYDLATGTPVEVDWTGRIHNFTAISGGTAVTERLGRRIRLHGLNLRFRVERLSNTDFPISFTMMVVLDTQQVGDTAPSASDIVSYTGDPDCGLGILNKQNTPRFRVLWRTTFLLADIQSGMNAQLIDKYLKLPPVNVGYNGSGSGDIERNGLYLVMTSGGDPAADEIFISGEGNMTYTDV